MESHSQGAGVVAGYDRALRSQTRLTLLLPARNTACLSSKWNWVRPKPGTRNSIWVYSM